MSEKWIQRSNMVSDGRGVAYYGRTVRDARGFFELLVSAQVGLRALTSERDEAVREAAELRAFVEEVARRGHAYWQERARSLTPDKAAPGARDGEAMNTERGQG